MHTAAVQEKKPGSSKPAPNLEAKPAFITREVFEKKYLNRKDDYKYEWADGVVEKTKRTMDKKQIFMLINLLAHFKLLENQGKVFGFLVPEVDLIFLDKYRRPDIAWLTKEQAYNLAEDAARDVPTFVIEVISTNDQVNRLKKKMVNYKDAGVQVVWHIFPEVRQVDVYSGPNLSQMTTFVGDEICSAAPALPGFTISVNDIFKKTQPA
ncbi:MAG: Uma2 family endonuclease [Saprospiraceae bacterium]|nr:Uma2 family endonuclease [Saprospiraceae bacterium]